MEANQRYVKNDEVEINLMSLLYHLLSKWRVFVALVLIGALLGAGVAALQNGGEQTAQIAPASQETLLKLNAYHNAKQRYDRQLQYETESPMMQLDPNQVHVGKLSYFVTVPQANREEVTQHYQSFTNDPATLAALRTAAGLEDDAAVGELIDVELLEENGLETASQYTAKLTFTVWSATPEQISQLLPALRSQADQMHAELQAKFSWYTSGNCVEYTQSKSDETLMKRQYNVSLITKEYNTQLTNLAKNMSADDYVQYGIVYEGKPSEMAAQKSSPVKLGLIAAVALVFIAALYECVRYLADSHLRSCDEVRDSYGLHVIANMKGENAKQLKGIDAKLHQMFFANAAPNNSRAFLLQALNAFDKQSIVLCGDAQDQDIAALVEWLGEQDTRFESAGLLHLDDAAQQKAVGAQGVVLMVKANQTTRQQLERELEICRALKLAMLGVVTVE